MVAEKIKPAESADIVADSAKIRLRLWIRLLRAARFIEAEIRERLRLEFDVTLPRFDVMAALYRHPKGMKMSHLSRFLMVSNGNVTGIVDRLVKDSLVIRSQPDGDRRSWVIKLTNPGTAAFEKMAGHHQNWINQLLQNIADEDTQMVAEILETITSNRQVRND